MFNNKSKILEKLKVDAGSWIVRYFIKQEWKDSTDLKYKHKEITELLSRF